MPLYNKFKHLIPRAIYTLMIKKVGVAASTNKVMKKTNIK